MKTQVKKSSLKFSTQGHKTPVQTGYPPFTTSASAKKRTPPSTERPSPKKLQIAVTSNAEMNTIRSKNSGVVKEISFDGFSVEFVRFGETMKEVLQPMRQDIQRLVEAQNLNMTATEMCEEVK